MMTVPFLAAIRKRTFSPKQLDGLQLWLDASQGVSVVGSAVTAWANQGLLGGNFNDNNAVAQRPTLVIASELNNKPALRFNGTTNWLISSLPGASFNFLRQANTFYIVYRTRINNPTNTKLRIFETRNTSFQCGYGVLYENINTSVRQHTISVRVGDVESPADDINVNNSNVDSAIAKAYTSTFTGTSVTNNLRLRRNGIEIGTTTTSSVVMSGTTRPNAVIGTGGGANGVNLFDGDIAEIIAYDRVLSPEELVQLEEYGRIKYNLY